MTTKLPVLSTSMLYIHKVHQLYFFSRVRKIIIKKCTTLNKSNFLSFLKVSLSSRACQTNKGTSVNNVIITWIIVVMNKKTRISACFTAADQTDQMRMRKNIASYMGNGAFCSCHGKLCSRSSSGQEWRMCVCAGAVLLIKKEETGKVHNMPSEWTVWYDDCGSPEVDLHFIMWTF